MRIDGSASQQVFSTSSDQVQGQDQPVKQVEKSQPTNNEAQEQLTQKHDIEKNLTKEELNKIINRMNGFMDQTHSALKFTFHEKLDEYYAKLINSETNEVIREIPPKKMLDMFAAMQDYLGLLIDKRI